MHADVLPDQQLGNGSSLQQQSSKSWTKHYVIIRLKNKTFSFRRIRTRAFDEKCQRNDSYQWKPKYKFDCEKCLRFEIPVHFRSESMLINVCLPFNEIQQVASVISNDVWKLKCDPSLFHFGYELLFSAHQIFWFNNWIEENLMSNSGEKRFKEPIDKGTVLLTSKVSTTVKEPASFQICLKDFW